MNEMILRDMMLNHLENVMNSHDDLDLQSSFFVDVGTMELPKAGKGLEITSLTGSNIQRKRPHIEVKNDDNLCLARVKAFAFACANKMATKEWKRLTNVHSLLPIEYFITYRRACIKVQEMSNMVLL